MNLKAFHIVFVAASSLLALVFGGWCLARGGTTYGIVGALAFVLAGGLVVYGFWFWRKITTPEEDRERRRKLFRSIPMLVALWLASEPSVWACSVCFGEAEGPMIDAARLGVWLLFGMVLAVQLCFVAFFLCLRRRAKRFEQTEVGGWHRPLPRSR